MSVTVRWHEPGKDLKAFLQVPYEIYRGDPAWVAPLKMEVAERLTPRKNPFFDHAEVALFTAHRDGRLCGRISAQVDHEHLRVHDDGAGFFGFFDTVDDVEVATALVSAATTWLAERGMTTIRGPLSLSINEEVGLLVDGFETPPCVMMPHHRDYQGRLAEAAGLSKAKDLLAWSYPAAPPTPRSDRALQTINALPEVRFRSIDKRRLPEEVDTALRIFNDAWQHNWGFVPATPGEAAKLARDLRLLIDPTIAFFAEVEGRAVALVIALPNLNEATRDLDGRLTPANLIKLVWRLKITRPKTARVMMVGIVNELRGMKRYGALSTALFAEVTRRGFGVGYQWAELSWTLEDNRGINLGIKAMGAHIYKRYRVYEKPIAG